jgi:hypothetical protein
MPILRRLILLATIFSSAVMTLRAEEFSIKSFTVTPVETDGQEHVVVFNVRYKQFAQTRGLLTIRALTPNVRFAEMFQGSDTMTTDQPVDGEKRNTLIKGIFVPSNADLVFEAELTATGQKIQTTYSNPNNTKSTNTAARESSIPEDVAREAISRAAYQIAERKNAQKRVRYAILLGQLSDYKILNQYTKKQGGETYHFHDYKVKFAGGQAHTFWGISEVRVAFVMRGDRWYWENVSN